MRSIAPVLRHLALIHRRAQPRLSALAPYGTPLSDRAPADGQPSWLAAATVPAAPGEWTTCMTDSVSIIKMFRRMIVLLILRFTIIYII